MLHDDARAGGRAWCELPARVNGGVNTGMNVVTDDGAEFASPSIDEDAPNHTAVILAIMSEIRGHGSCPQIDFHAQHGVADIRKMANISPGHEERVF